MLVICAYCPAKATKQCVCNSGFFCTTHCADHLLTPGMHTIIDPTIRLDSSKQCLLKNAIFIRLKTLENCKASILSHTSNLQTKIDLLCKNSIHQLDLLSHHFSAFLKVENYTIIQLKEVESILETTISCDFNPNYETIDKIEEYFSQKFYEESSPWNRLLKIYSGKINSLAVTSDKTTLITCGEDCGIKFLSLSTKRVLHVLEGHTREILSIALSKNNKFLVSGSSDRTVRLWDAIQLTEIYVFKGHTKSVLSVAISDDSTFFASGSADGSICVWNLADHRLYLTISDLGAATALIFSKQNLLFCSSNGKIIEWDLKNKAQLNELVAQRFQALCLALSSDNKKIVSGGTKGAIFHWANKKLIGQIGSHKSDVHAICFANKDENIISASEDHTVKISSLRKNREIFTFDNHTKSVRCLAPVSDDLFVSGSDDYTLRLWDTTTLELYSKIELKKISIHEVAIYGKCVAYIANKSLIIYDLLNEKIESLINVSEMKVSSIALGSIYAVFAYKANGYEIRVYHRLEKCHMSLLPKDSQPISALASSYSLVVSASHDNTIKIWDLAYKKLLRDFIAHRDIILSVAISSNCKFIATGSKDLTAKLWSVRPVELVFVFSGHMRPVERVIFSLDERFTFIASSEESICIWDNFSGREIYNLKSLEQANEMLGSTIEMQNFAQSYLF
jgi:WD40 repeat protein